jgi:transcriptional regulator with XRE-family HTH domain
MSTGVQTRRPKRKVARPSRRPGKAPARPSSAGFPKQKALTNFGIAGRVRHARLARGARLKDIAAAARCSESLISKIENGKINPSLNVLHRICDALGLTIGELFGGSGNNSHVVTAAADRLVVEFDALRRGTGLRMERLVPHARGHLLQGNIHVIAPGGSTDGVISHDGEEVGYVIAGEIELNVDGHVHRAKAGDSFCYRSELPHGYRNSGKSEARVLFVNTPPSF